MVTRLHEWRPLSADDVPAQPAAYSASMPARVSKSLYARVYPWQTAIPSTIAPYSLYAYFLRFVSSYWQLSASQSCKASAFCRSVMLAPILSPRASFIASLILASYTAVSYLGLILVNTPGFLQLFILSISSFVGFVVSVFFSVFFSVSFWVSFSVVSVGLVSVCSLSFFDGSSFFVSSVFATVVFADARARFKKVTICPLVQVSFGENVVADVPLVTPFLTAQETACA